MQSSAPFLFWFFSLKQGQRRVLNRGFLVQLSDPNKIWLNFWMVSVYWIHDSVLRQHGSKTKTLLYILPKGLSACITRTWCTTSTIHQCDVQVIASSWSSQCLRLINCSELARSSQFWTAKQNQPKPSTTSSGFSNFSSIFSSAEGTGITYTRLSSIWLCNPPKAVHYQSMFCHPGIFTQTK